MTLVHSSHVLVTARRRYMSSTSTTEIDELAEARLVERRASVVLGQHIPELRVVALDGVHRIVDELADRGLLGLVLQVSPAGLGRYPEDVLGAVLVGVLGVSALLLLGLEPGVRFLEGVGDVLEEDKAEDDVLVLGGVHRAAQRVGHFPELGLVADVGGGRLGSLLGVLRFGHMAPRGPHTDRK